MICWCSSAGCHPASTMAPQLHTTTNGAATCINRQAAGRSEVKTLLLADRAAAETERAGAAGPPSWRLLGGAAVVAGIPYVAFGCLDNCIMVGACAGACTLAGGTNHDGLCIVLMLRSPVGACLCF